MRESVGGGPSGPCAEPGVSEAPGAADPRPSRTLLDKPLGELWGRQSHLERWTSGVETSSQLEGGRGPEREALPRTGGTHEPFPLRVLGKGGAGPPKSRPLVFNGRTHGLGWAAFCQSLERV